MHELKLSDDTVPFPRTQKLQNLKKCYQFPIPYPVKVALVVGSCHPICHNRNQMDGYSPRVKTAKWYQFQGLGVMQVNNSFFFSSLSCRLSTSWPQLPPWLWDQSFGAKKGWKWYLLCVGEKRLLLLFYSWCCHDYQMPGFSHACMSNKNDIHDPRDLHAIKV